MDAQMKTKEVNISANDQPKIAKIGGYWLEEQTTKIVNFLREYQDV